MPTVRSLRRLSMVLVAGVAMSACASSDDATPATRPPTTPETTVSESTTTEAATSTTVARAFTVGDLDPALDNGALGRNTFADPRDVTPEEACADTLDTSLPADTSRVVRVLPEGPRAADGTLAFTSGVCVYLPPGYGTTGLRYPTIFLLHGGGGDAADAVAYGGISDLLDAAADSDPATASIVVMPDGTDGQWLDRPDGEVMNATYVLDYLVPYIDERFDTLGTRTARAVIGISNGGFGAMHLASLAPDVFAMAGGMSSNLSAISLSADWTQPLELPIDRAANLDEVDIILDIATSCDSDDPVDVCFSLAVDLAFLGPNRAFVETVNGTRAASGSTAALQYTEREGSHDWRWWSEWLREHQLPFAWERLDPAS